MLNLLSNFNNMGKESLLKFIKIETGFLSIAIFVIALLWYLITINYIKRVSTENCDAGTTERKNKLIGLYTVQIVIMFTGPLLLFFDIIKLEHLKIFELIKFIINMLILFNVFKLLKEIDKSNESCSNGIDKNAIKTLNYLGIFMLILQLLSFIGICMMSKEGCTELLSKHPATSIFFKDRNMEQGCK